MTGGPRPASSTRPSPDSRQGGGFDLVLRVALAISWLAMLPAFGYLSDDAAYDE